MLSGSSREEVRSTSEPAGFDRHASEFHVLSAQGPYTCSYFQAWHLLDSPPTLTVLSSEIPPALILGSPSMSFGLRGQAWVWLSPLSSVTSPRPWARPYTVCGVVVRIKCHDSVNVFTVVNTKQTPSACTSFRGQLLL